MAAGQTEKPARFWRVGACSLIPWQSTDMQRLRRGSLPIDVQFGGWPNGETCAVSEGRSVFSDPLAVD